MFYGMIINCALSQAMPMLQELFVFCSVSLLLYQFYGRGLCVLTGSSMLGLSSRSLPQRAWAAAVPTLLSHDALSKLLTPTAAQPGEQPCSPLERFLATVYLRRYLQRIVQSPDNVSSTHYAVTYCSTDGRELYTNKVTYVSCFVCIFFEILAELLVMSLIQNVVP